MNLELEYVILWSAIGMTLACWFIHSAWIIAMIATATWALVVFVGIQPTVPMGREQLSWFASLLAMYLILGLGCRLMRHALSKNRSSD